MTVEIYRDDYETALLVLIFWKISSFQTTVLFMVIFWTNIRNLLPHLARLIYNKSRCCKNNKNIWRHFKIRAWIQIKKTWSHLAITRYVLWRYLVIAIYIQCSVTWCLLCFLSALPATRHNWNLKVSLFLSMILHNFPKLTALPECPVQENEGDGNS